MNAYTVHFVSLDGDRINLVVWGSAEELRHLGVCLEDAQRAGECQAAYLVPGAIAGVNHWNATEWEEAFIAWRRGEETAERVECHACGIQTPKVDYMFDRPQMCCACE